MTTKTEAIERAATAVIAECEGAEIPFNIHKFLHELKNALALPPDQDCANCEQLRRDKENLKKGFELWAENERLETERLTAQRDAWKAVAEKANQMGLMNRQPFCDLLEAARALEEKP